MINLFLRAKKPYARYNEPEKKYLSEIVGLPPPGFKVLYRDVGFSFGLHEMKYDPKKLYTYNINDGDEIHMWSYDLAKHCFKIN